MKRTLVNLGYSEAMTFSVYSKKDVQALFNTKYDAVWCNYSGLTNIDILKLAKKAAPKIEDETLDEEALLQMTEDIPLSDDDMGPDELEILDDEAELDDTESSELTGFVDQFDDEEQNDK